MMDVDLHAKGKKRNGIVNMKAGMEVLIKFRLMDEEGSSAMNFDDSERDWVDIDQAVPPSQEKLLDADFFNNFQDDFDEDDIVLLPR
jgi:hypothetical protein